MLLQMGYQKNLKIDSTEYMFNKKFDFPQIHHLTKNK